MEMASTLVCFLPLLEELTKEEMSRRRTFPWQSDFGSDFPLVHLLILIV
ncbi:hypothetical protein HAT2_00692 [Candidatus Similichlamydia laticola]|uniref:Uncharacterized protein n=1 Tax=Candidatus Similichlamydia laticola TaxID=2170265 RepID=A0A369KC87_9BACT|nr:hypothetical protein HAT2_00692 [Candidatus Similichlamydia laticola]